MLTVLATRRPYSAGHSACWRSNWQWRRQSAAWVSSRINDLRRKGVKVRLVEIARSTGVRPSRYKGGDRLDNEAFKRLSQALATAGHHLDAADARVLLHASRATYEPLLDALATYFMSATPDWLPKAFSQDRMRASTRTPARIGTE